MVIGSSYLLKIGWDAELKRNISIKFIRFRRGRIILRLRTNMRDLNCWTQNT